MVMFVFIPIVIPINDSVRELRVTLVLCHINYVKSFASWWSIVSFLDNQIYVLVWYMLNLYCRFNKKNIASHLITFICNNQKCNILCLHKSISTVQYMYIVLLLFPISASFFIWSLTNKVMTYKLKTILG